MSDALSHNHGSLRWPQQLYDALAGFNLAIPIPQVQDETELDDVNFALERPQPCVFPVHKIRGDKILSRKAVLVAEETRSQGQELGLFFKAQQVGGRGTVVRQLAQILSKAAPDVEEDMALVFDAVEDNKVDVMPAKREVEKVKGSDARPGEDLPDLVAL
jgi:hypothetical protein